MLLGGAPGIQQRISLRLHPQRFLIGFVEGSLELPPPGRLLIHSKTIEKSYLVLLVKTSPPTQPQECIHTNHCVHMHDSTGHLYIYIYIQPMQDSSSVPVRSSPQPNPVGVASTPCVLLAARHRCLSNGATQVNTTVLQIILNHTCHNTCHHTSVRGSPQRFFRGSSDVTIW